MRAIKLSQVRRRAAASVVALIILGAMLFGAAAPVGAYYGEMEGYVAIDFSHVDRGCYYRITVMAGKRVQVYCNLKNGSSGATVSKSNYIEYDCWSGSGCVYEGYISGWSGWYPVGFWVMKKDDWGGQHAIINEVGTR